MTMPAVEELPPDLRKAFGGRTLTQHHVKMTLFYYIGIKDKITSPHAKEKNSTLPFADIM
jgi:hypothetical protein